MSGTSPRDSDARPLGRTTLEVVGYSGDGRAWNTMLASVLMPVTEVEARRHHVQGAQYGVVLNDDEGVIAVTVGGENGYHGVKLYDPTAQREHTTYGMSNIGGRLWLSQLSRYSGGTRTVPRDLAKAEHFRWPGPDAVATWNRFDPGQQRRVTEERNDWNPDAHWFDLPEFGHYEHLVDRGLIERLWPGAAPLPFLGP